jgi:hypothetical protein
MGTKEKPLDVTGKERYLQAKERCPVRNQT